MAKLLTKAKHCMKSIPKENQEQNSNQNPSKIFSLTKKKRYTNVPITSSHNHHNRNDNFHINKILTNNNYKKGGNNMCLACSKSKLPQSSTSSLNNPLHAALSATTSTTSNTPAKDDLDEGMSRSTSATSTASTASTISTCSSTASTPPSTPSSPARKSDPLSTGAKSSFSGQHHVIDMNMSTEIRRGILVTSASSRSTKKKKRVQFAPPLAGSDGPDGPADAANADQDLPPLPCNASPVSKTNSPQQSIDTETKSSNSYPVHTTVVEYIQPSSTMTETQRDNAYWQLRDYEYFRGTAQIIANEVLKVTATQTPTSQSYNSVMTRVYDLCAVLSEREHLEQQQQKKNQEKKSKQASDTDGTELEKSSGNVGEELDDGTTASISTMDSTIPSSFSSLSSTSSNPPPSLSSPPSNSNVMIPPHLFAALTHWVKAGHSRRGLEKFCVTSHIRTRPMAKAATVQAVLLAQDLLHQLKEEQQQLKEKKQSQPTKFQIGVNEFSLENSSEEDVLRAVSERFSKTSKYYGTAIGLADAAAVGNYEHPLKN